MIPIEPRINPVHDGIHSYGVACHISAGGVVSAEVLRRFAKALMAETASACISSGARDVSHIKAYIEHDTGFVHADTVGDNLDVKVEGRDGGPAASFKLVVNAVIYGLSADKVRDNTEASIDIVIGRFGFSRKPGSTGTE